MRRLATAGVWLATAAWTAIQGAYWGVALGVRPYVSANLGQCYWTSTPPGRLVPWPSPSGILRALSPCRNVADHAVAILLTFHLWPVALVLSSLAVFALSRYLQLRYKQV